MKRKHPPLKVIPGWKGDEKYVGDTPRPKPPDPERYAPNPYGPDASNVLDPPNYVAVYYGSPALNALSPYERLVYGYVRGWNEVNKPCYASCATIAKCTGISESTAKRAIKALAKRGYLQLTKRPGNTTLIEAHRAI